MIPHEVASLRDALLKTGVTDDEEQALKWASLIRDRLMDDGYDVRSKYDD